MNRLGTGVLGCLNDLVDPQVRFRSSCRTQADRDIGGLGVCRLGVGIGVHGNRFDAQRTAGAHNAQGDFTAVGNENC